MFVRKTLLIGFLAVILLYVVAITPLGTASLGLAQSLSRSPEVYDIARATTVLIGADLSEGAVEAVDEAEDAGSGVIIARQSKPKNSLATGDSKSRLIYRYWVLTNAHVVELENTRYGIRTADGEVYPEGNHPDEKGKGYQHQPQIYRFGGNCSNVSQNAANQKDCFSGTDLAVLTFYSENKYPVAALGDPAAVKAAVKAGKYPGVVVSGWPMPKADGKRVRITQTGNVKQVLPLKQIAGNYTLVTTLRSKQGISGGPVFNQAGELIGIYGKGQKQDEEIGSGDNYAIDIGQFIALQSAKGVNEQKKYMAAFTPPPPILRALTPKDPQAASFGKKHARTGDNMTSEERKKLYLADLLPDDPRRSAISQLDRKFGCWLNYEDGTSGGGLLEDRGQFAQDLNGCLDKVNELIAASSANFITQEELEAFNQKIQALKVRVAKLSTSSSNASTDLCQFWKKISQNWF